MKPTTIAVAASTLLATAALSEPARHPAPSVSWTCTYPGFFGDNKTAVTVTYAIQGDKVVDAELGAPQFDLVENNDYALIAVQHFAMPDSAAVRGTVRIVSSTIIIDKTFGQFIYMVGEIGNEPVHRRGRCIKGTKSN
jgi:hypothetical protein